MKKSPFVAVVEQALKRFQDPEWLGANSPLASPYFLGARLTENAVTSLARGRVLQQLLRSCCEQIAGRHQDRFQTILKEYYFQGRTVDAVCDVVGLGRNSFHLSRNEAIDALAELIVAQTNPALRLETPPQVSAILDYDEHVETCLAMLRENASVTILGSGGVGKTTVGAVVVKRMDVPSFWYTIYPGLTDTLDSFLFAFGYFLYAYGSPALWLELVAAETQPKSERLLSVVRYTLAQFPHEPPLICLDEIDLLNPTLEPHHAPLATFLENLRGLARLVLIGQGPLIDTVHYCTLPGLSDRAVRQLLRDADIALSPDQVTRLLTKTHGNPRLLELYITLYQTHDSFDSLLQQSGVLHDEATPPIELLLNRILQRVNDDERGLMMELSVFRRPAPIDIWASGTARLTLEKLSTYRLITSDQNGGIALLPAYRQPLYAMLPDEKRQELHAGAAIIRNQYGDFVGAIYHLIQAEQIEEAILLSYEQRKNIVNQGYASTILNDLEELDSALLTETATETLNLLKSDFLQLTGHRAKALNDIRSLLWRTPILALDANRLAGVISNDASDFTSAEESFRRSLKIAEQIVELRTSDVHRGLAWRFLREREMDNALEETQLARYEVDHLRGELERELGNFGDAHRYYQEALATAQSLQYAIGIAKTSTSLALLCIMTGLTEESQTYLHEATSAYKKLGMVIHLASIDINWAVAYNMAGDYEAAIAAAEHAEKNLAQFGEIPVFQQGLLELAQSEAYLGLNQLNEAAEFAQKALAHEDIYLMPDAYRTLGEVLAQREQMQESMDYLRTSIDLANQTEDPYLAGYGWRALGQTLRLNNEAKEAADAFNQAITLFQQMNLTYEVEKTQALMK